MNEQKNAWRLLPNAAHIDSVIASVKAHSDVWVTAQAASWAAGNAACSVIIALIAYDDSAKYLSMTSDQLRVWVALSEEPAAVLLLPAVIAREKINELETA